MEKAAALWKVFFPQHCLNTPSGICLGWTCTKRQLICIVGIAHTTTKDISHYLTHCRNPVLQIVGIWSNDAFRTTSKNCDDGTPDKSLHKQLGINGCKTELVLHQYEYNCVPTCELYTQNENSQSRTVASNLFILYDVKQLIASSLDSPEIWTLPSDVRKKREDPHDKKCAVEKLDCQRTDIEEVFHLVQNSVWMLRKLKCESDFRLSCGMFMEERKSWIRNGWRLFGVVCCLPLKLLFALLLFLFKNRLFENRAIQWMVHFPSSSCQLIHKFGSIQSVLERDDQSSQASDARNGYASKVGSKEQQICNKQRRGNIICSIAVDVCMGVLLMIWLQHNDLPTLFAEWILVWANTTGDQLQQLLHWLMGNPAGLKLNSPFAHFLGHFFLYHVYLWMGYLNVIGPFLSMLIWCMAVSGCLGLSVLLSVASDMLAVLTFHIYCFYVYAAKIYTLQMSSLLSLSRLFRGKKWNVLRHRVDSCSYDIDQLFMGTLLFTMLLFLLPTTALFYTVFTLLRLVLLIIQSILSKLVHQLNTLPMYSLILWLLKSDSLSDGIEFHVKSQVDGKPPYLIMKVQSMSLSRVLQIGRKSFLNTNDANQETTKGSIIDLGKKLLLGHLVYPWGEKRTD